jgi:putative transposase
MARLPRYVFPAAGIFHATARGAGRIPIYRDENDRLFFLGLLADAVEHFEWECYAYCLITNHYHLVIEADRDKMSDGFQMLNGIHARSFNGRHKRWGHLFGDRFWCRVVAEERLENTCRYVMANPVRAGLCEGISDWPWSACRYDLG